MTLKVTSNIISAYSSHWQIQGYLKTSLRKLNRLLQVSNKSASTSIQNSEWTARPKKNTSIFTTISAGIMFYLPSHYLLWLDYPGLSWVPSMQAHLLFTSCLNPHQTGGSGFFLLDHNGQTWIYRLVWGRAKVWFRRNRNFRTGTA